MLDLVLPFLPGWSAGTQSTATPPVPVPVASGAVRPAFGYPFYSDFGTWYGGSYRITRPIGNLATNDLDEFARTTDLTIASCTARNDLGSIESIGGFFVPSGNWTVNAKIRFTLANSDANLTASPLYQSAWLPMFPSGVNPRLTTGKNIGLLHLLRDIDGSLLPVSAQFAMQEVDDAGNPNGALDLGRSCVMGLYVLPRGMAVGMRDYFIDASTETENKAGGSWFDLQRIKRAREFQSARLDEADAYGTPWEMQWELGRSGQVVTIFNVNDTIPWKRVYLARLEEVSGLEWPYSTAARAKWRLKEVL